MLKANLANVTRREYKLAEIKARERKAKKSKTTDEDVPLPPAPALEGAGDPPELELKGIMTGFDPTGAARIKKIALAEMDALPSDGQETERLGRIVLTPIGQELVVGKALNARSAVASQHVPPMTYQRFPRIVYQPAPLGKAPVFTGGGEASALSNIAELKRYGRVSMAPRYEQPDEVLKAITMDDVRRSGDPNYNRFRGFHGDHAYAAFHPSDVRCRGVFDPDMNIAPDLVAAGAWGFVAAGAAMTLPTTAVFFSLDGPVDDALYSEGTSVVKVCRRLCPVRVARF